MLNHQSSRLTAALRARASQSRARLEALARQRVFRKPLERIHEAGRRLDELAVRSRRAALLSVTDARAKTQRLEAQVESLSPLAVLARGYSLTERTGSGELVGDAASLRIGDSVTTVFSRGRVQSRVEAVDAPQEPS